MKFGWYVAEQRHSLPVANTRFMDLTRKRIFEMPPTDAKLRSSIEKTAELYATFFQK